MGKYLVVCNDIVILGYLFLPFPLRDFPLQGKDVRGKAGIGE